jgi:predicted transcriptional regulator
VGKKVFLGEAEMASNGSYRGLGKKRRMVGLTQHDLARLTGIPVSRIVFVETGRLDLEPDELISIRRVLKQRARQVAKDVGGQA